MQGRRAFTDVGPIDVGAFVFVFPSQFIDRRKVDPVPSLLMPS